jgi:hypothetical protein
MSGLVNVSDVILDPLFSIAFELERFSGAFTVEGAYARGTPTVLTRVGSIQPANNNDLLQFLPEGERDGKFIKCYCAEEIRIGDGGDIESDQIIWRGIHYRVVFAKHYENYGYWFVIASEA